MTRRSHPLELVLSWTSCASGDANMSPFFPGHLWAIGISLLRRDSLGDYHWLSAQETRSLALLEVQLFLGNTLSLHLPPMCALSTGPSCVLRKAPLHSARPRAPLGGCSGRAAGLSDATWHLRYVGMNR